MQNEVLPEWNENYKNYRQRLFLSDTSCRFVLSMKNILQCRDEAELPTANAEGDGGTETEKLIDRRNPTYQVTISEASRVLPRLTATKSGLDSGSSQSLLLLEVKTPKTWSSESGGVSHETVKCGTLKSSSVKCGKLKELWNSNFRRSTAHDLN